MSARSSKWTKSIAMLAAVAAVGVSLPERPASAQLQAVPRAGFTFTDQLTERVNVESIDTATRTGIFVLPDGRWLNLSIADSVRGIDKINDGSNINITYTEVVTILNLKRKGVGSRAARNDSINPSPEPGEEPVRLNVEHARWLGDLRRVYDRAWVSACPEDLNRYCGALIGLEPMPRVPMPPTPFDPDAKVAAVNAQIKALADGQRVSFIDIGPQMIESDGMISTNMMPDFVHPTAQGYQIWADAIVARR